MHCALPSHRLQQAARSATMAPRGKSGTREKAPVTSAPCASAQMEWLPPPPPPPLLLPPGGAYRSVSAAVRTVSAAPAVEMSRAGGGRALRFTMARLGRSSKAPVLGLASSRRMSVSERKEKRALPHSTVEAGGAGEVGAKRVCELAGAASSASRRAARAADCIADCR